MFNSTISKNAKINDLLVKKYVNEDEVTIFYDFYLVVFSESYPSVIHIQKLLVDYDITYLDKMKKHYTKTYKKINTFVFDPNSYSNILDLDEIHSFSKYNPDEKYEVTFPTDEDAFYIFELCGQKKNNFITVKLRNINIPFFITKIIY